MKRRIFAFVCSLLVAFMLVTPVEAFAKQTEYGPMFVAEVHSEDYSVSYENLANTIEQTDHALYEYYGYISTKPFEDNKTGLIVITFDVEAAGQYDIDITYTAKTSTAVRKMGIAANKKTDLKQVELPMAADWDTMQTYTFKCNLNKGSNYIAIGTPFDYDNNLVKTPNIYAIYAKLVQEEDDVKTSDVTPLADGTKPTPTVKPAKTPTPKPTKKPDSLPKTADEGTIVLVSAASIAALFLTFFLKKKEA